VVPLRDEAAGAVVAAELEKTMAVVMANPAGDGGLR
jgi:hypothetical protein